MSDRELEVCLARPHSEKKPTPMYTPIGAGILPQVYQSRIGGGYGHGDLGMMDSLGFGLNRGYGQVCIATQYEDNTTLISLSLLRLSRSAYNEHNVKAPL